MIKKLIKFGGILVVVSVVASVFLGGDDTSTNSNPNAPDTTQATPVSNCSNVGSSLLKVIYEGDGFELTNGKSVKFGDNPPARYVSAEFTNSGSLGIDGEVGTWLVLGEIGSPDYIEGVGGFGEEYSSWGSGINNKQGSPYDSAYSESRDCVK